MARVLVGFVIKNPLNQAALVEFLPLYMADLDLNIGAQVTITEIYRGNQQFCLAVTSNIVNDILDMCQLTNLFVTTGLSSLEYSVFPQVCDVHDLTQGSHQA